MNHFVNAQSLWIDGVIFDHEKSDYIAIPFATVKYCDASNHDLVYYIRFTDLTGKYDLGKNVLPRDYYVSIEAPGYVPRSKTIVNLPDHFDKEFTLHYQLLRNDCEQPVSVVNYPNKTLKKNVKRVREIFSFLDFTINDNEVCTIDGEKVQVLFNGVNVTTLSTDIEIVDKLLALPIKYIKEAEVYDIHDKQTSFPYRKVVNIILAKEDVAEYRGKIRGTPGETSYYDKK